MHSLVLVITDIAGIAGGALAAFRILGVPNQIWVQLPIALVLSVGCFCAWILVLRVRRWTGLLPASATEFKACLAASFLWAPLVFVPLHYFTQGYLTSLGNLVALALYQLPVNGLALFASSVLQNSASGRGTQQRASPKGGPVVPVANSQVTEGPPSVS
jgi:hypothetical protein